MTFTIKVDRVQSLEFAKKLEGLGVNLIGISLAQFTPKDMILLRRNLSQDIKIALEISSREDLSLAAELIVEYQIDYLQIPQRIYCSIKKSIERNKIPVILSGLEASYDDDPSWILPLVKDKSTIAFYQIDLLPDMVDSWNFLKQETPQFQNELQINDLVVLGQQAPLLITTNFSSDNVEEIIYSLPSAQGVFLTISSEEKFAHSFTENDLIKILEALKKKSKFV